MHPCRLLGIEAVDLAAMMFCSPGPNVMAPIAHDLSAADPVPEAVHLHSAEGWNLYMRPALDRGIGCLLVDDLSRDGVEAMLGDGLPVRLVIETSKDNFQVWCAAHSMRLPEAVRDQICKWMATRYGGDMMAAKAAQLGRLPGFPNHKPGRDGYVCQLRYLNAAVETPDWMDAHALALKTAHDKVREKLLQADREFLARHYPAP